MKNEWDWFTLFKMAKEGALAILLPSCWTPAAPMPGSLSHLGSPSVLPGLLQSSGGHKEPASRVTPGFTAVPAVASRPHPSLFTLTPLV